MNGPSTYPTFALALHDLMRAERLATQAELADHLGVEQSTANRWINGHRAPAPSRAPALAILFGWPEDDMRRLLRRSRTPRDSLERIKSVEDTLARLDAEVGRVLDHLGLDRDDT